MRRTRYFRRVSVLSWVLGYFDAELPRVFCEPFLNLCMRYGLTYYSLHLDAKRGVLLVRAPLSMRRRMLTACRLRQMRMKILRTHGLPHHLSALVGRWGLVLGAVLSIVLLALSQSVLWRVDVVCEGDAEREQVLRVLEDEGICVGARISDISTESAEQRIMIREHGIAWISISIRGTVARVELRWREGSERSDVGTGSPSNLVSDFDAQVVSLEVWSGSASVREGDIVRRGDLLVSGIIGGGESSPTRYTDSVGCVIGRVRCDFEVRIPLEQIKKVPTGEKISQKTLIFFGKSIKLFANCGKIPPTCDIISCKHVLDPLSLGELPVAIVSEDYYPYLEQVQRISVEEAITQAYEELYLRISETLPEAQILKKELSWELCDGEYVLRCTVSALCNIARRVGIEIDGQA